MSAMSIRPLVIAACAAAVAIARAAQIIRVISDCAAGSVNLPAPAPIFTGGTFFLVIGNRNKYVPFLNAPFVCFHQHNTALLKT